jgi:hypothetical protein
MSNKKLAAILGGCIAVIIAVVAIASLPPASGGRMAGRRMRIVHLALM